MEDTNTDLFDEQDAVETQGGAEDAATETPAQTAPEYFLEVNERQRYRTVDDARKAYDEAGRTIASYSRFGKPDELASRLERLKLLEQLAGGQKPAGSTDPLSDLSPEQRKQWESYWDRNQKLLEQNGYVKADVLKQQLSAEIREQIKRESVENTARAEFTRLATERGLDVPLIAIENAAVALAETDQSLADLYNAGDGAGFAKQIMDRLYGAMKKEPQRERGSDGKFKATAADEKAAAYQDAKDKTKQLKPPPKGNTASADNSGSEEERKKLLDPSYRLKRAREMAEERAA